MVQCPGQTGTFAARYNKSRPTPVADMVRRAPVRGNFTILSLIYRAATRRRAFVLDRVHRLNAECPTFHFLDGRLLVGSPKDKCERCGRALA